MGRFAVIRFVCWVAAVVVPISRDVAAQSLRDDFYVTNGRVESTALAGNTLYIGGTFTQVGPRTGSGVPIDQTTGLPVAGFPEVTGFILDAAPDGSGGWYIAGNIAAVGGEYPAPRSPTSWPTTAWHRGIPSRTSPSLRSR